MAVPNAAGVDPAVAAAMGRAAALSCKPLRFSPRHPNPQSTRFSDGYRQGVTNPAYETQQAHPVTVFARQPS